MKNKGLLSLLHQASTDVQETTGKVVQAMKEAPAGSQDQDYGQAVANAIVSYAQMTCNFIRSIGEQQVANAESFLAESNALADNIEKCAELEADRCRDFTYRMREAAMTMKAAKESFERTTGHKINGGSASDGMPSDEEKISNLESHLLPENVKPGETK